MQTRCVQMLAIAMIAGAAASSQGATVYVDPSGAGWNGFMNVFDLGGGYQFSSGWGINDLNASFNDGANKLKLSPNTIGDPNPYWYIGGGAPGNPGNKIMEANLYRQVSDGSLSGQTVTFQGTVLSNSFTSAHTAIIFIRDFAPDFSSFTESTIALTAGAFSFSHNTAAGAGRHVQWGFQVKGVNVWTTDTAPFGFAEIATIPGPATLALGALGLFAGRRRR
jgi:hypothetical protein